MNLSKIRSELIPVLLTLLVAIPLVVWALNRSDQPDSATVAFNQAGDLNSKRLYDEAIEHYTEAIRLKREFGEAYLNRGIVYGNKKEDDKAIADYQEAVRIFEAKLRNSPHDQIATVNLALAKGKLSLVQASNAFSGMRKDFSDRAGERKRLADDALRELEKLRQMEEAAAQDTKQRVMAMSIAGFVASSPPGVTDLSLGWLLATLRANFPSPDSQGTLFPKMDIKAVPSQLTAPPGFDPGAGLFPKMDMPAAPPQTTALPGIDLGETAFGPTAKQVAGFIAIGSPIPNGPLLMIIYAEYYGIR